MAGNEPPLCGVFERACSRRKSSKTGDGRQSSEATGAHRPCSGGSMGKRSEADFAHRPAAWRSGGFSAPKLLKIPELRLSTFPSKKAPNPPFCQTACWL